MVRAATLLRRLLCLAMAVTLVVPAAASGAHSLWHGKAGLAAAGQHHVSPAETPAGDKQDGGHDHQLGLFAPVAVLFGEAALVHPPIMAPPSPEMIVKTLVLRPAEPPPADPPRLA